MNAVDSAEPFWGPPTSKANFCETDYAVSRYIAEFINSLTNVVYSKQRQRGIPERLRQKANKHGDSLRVLPYWGLMAVGLCSLAFHVSLKYHTQMMDDLSMHFATTPVLHRILTANSNRRDSVVMAIVLGSMLLFLVTYHVRTDELILHSVSFVGTVTVIGIHTMRLVNNRTLPGSASRRQIWGMVRFGAAIFNLGYWLWLIDRWACGFLRDAREAIGLPWAFVLELHGWWHICTGIGAYVFIAVVDHLVSGEDLRDIQQSFAWPAPWASRSIFAGRGPSVDGGGKGEAKVKSRLGF
ncbi:ceramidase [Aspergillus clavatus NRRL 1]|uniref:Alkaline ceramidase family protein n=1 Tax=Aspergillus clavatus (strain ATCC 1007 / CBS 513.65 / DSM 816 / NCTC 3887 / NRRL 1 / QM 1276 / 107) TaxID=344612 RepID=A1CS80_ASPCL|nr:alkaline ceramidase family protein [Aspergillus clavatus NRRL 1]EAW08501.1 alkaline ceramidase family protein [Aspergillus clavatus NRRL 1]